MHATIQPGRHRGDGQLHAPGVVRTGFGRESRPLLKLGIMIARPFMASPERGADTIVYLASPPDVAGQTGGTTSSASGASRRPPRATTRPRGNCGSSARS